jgi:phage terminase small subunit
MASGDFTKLQPRQRKYIQALAQGMSRREALRVAQYSENTAPSRVENASVKAAFARIVRRAVPAHVLAQVIAEGVQATETKFFQHKGKVMDQREVIAWGPRSSFAKIAAEYGGYVEPDRGVSDSTQIEVLVRFIGEA